MILMDFPRNRVCRQLHLQMLPPENPRKYGSASELRKNPWVATPAVLSAAPMKNAIRILGNLSSKTIEDSRGSLITCSGLKILNSSPPIQSAKKMTINRIVTRQNISRERCHLVTVVLNDILDPLDPGNQSWCWSMNLVGIFNLNNL